MPKKPRAICVGSTPTTPITSKERKEIAKQINKGREELRKVYPEVRGKVVDFISHMLTDGRCTSAFALPTTRTFPFDTPRICSLWEWTSPIGKPGT